MTKTRLNILTSYDRYLKSSDENVYLSLLVSLLSNHVYHIQFMLRFCCYFNLGCVVASVPYFVSSPELYVIVLMSLSWSR